MQHWKHYQQCVGGRAAGGGGGAEGAAAGEGGGEPSTLDSPTGLTAAVSL